MKKTMMMVTAAAVLALSMGGSAYAEGIDGEKIFKKKKCSMCHAVDKKKMGPALKDMNSDVAVLKETVTNGRKSMPAFGKKLSEEEIDAVVAFVASKNASATNPCAAH